ncbi:MAG: arginase family protein [Planctomycetota bacterium]
MTTPRTTLPNARTTPRFAGLSTFGRYPRLEDVSPEHRPVDWAIVGSVYDCGVTYRPGARFGARAIREQSQYLKPFHTDHNVMLTDVFSLADAGDAPLDLFSAENNARVLAEHLEGVADPSTKILMLGGDHSNTLGALRAAHARAGAPGSGLAMLHFDSHLDTVDAVWGEKYSHASPFIRAVEEGVLDPARMLSVGIKGPLNTPRDLDYARDHGVEIVTYEDWKREGTARIDAFLTALGDAPCYLSFDIDCVDPVFAPGTGTPSVGGFTSAEVLDLLRNLARAHPSGGPNLVGADVVEVLPDRDVAGNTALLAAHVAFEILCLNALATR